MKEDSLAERDGDEMFLDIGRRSETCQALPVH